MLLLFRLLSLLHLQNPEKNQKTSLSLFTEEKRGRLQKKNISNDKVQNAFCETQENGGVNVCLERE